VAAVLLAPAVEAAAVEVLRLQVPAAEEVVAAEVEVVEAGLPLPPQAHAHAAGWEPTV
jgi:hypothetical protein